MEKIEKKLDKKDTLWYSGFALLIIFVALIVNFVLIFPIGWSIIWVYGIIFLAGGLGAYFVSLFFLESFHFFLELFSIAIIGIGEFLIVMYFVGFEIIWISVYFIIPSVTFLGLAALTYDLHPPELKNRRDIAGGIIVVSGSLILLIIEAVVRASSQTMTMPILGIILIAGGLLFYMIATWKILKKPSYVVTLIGAAIISVGIFFIEICYQLYNPLLATIFLAPGLVFFVLILINYKLLRTGAMSKSQFRHQSGQKSEYESNPEAP